MKCFILINYNTGRYHYMYNAVIDVLGTLFCFNIFKIIASNINNAFSWYMWGGIQSFCWETGRIHFQTYFVPKYVGGELIGRAMFSVGSTDFKFLSWNNLSRQTFRLFTFTNITYILEGILHIEKILIFIAVWIFS
jgi:hypothetical protein